MTMYKENAINQLKQISKHYRLINDIYWTLYQDMEINTSTLGMQDKAEQLSYLDIEIQKLLSDKAIPELLAAATTASGEMGEVEKAVCRLIKRKYDEKTKITPDYINRKNELDAKSVPIWREARAKKEFKIFAPLLQKQVDLAKEKAELLGSTQTPYDALLDNYITGMSVAKFDSIIIPLKDYLVSVIPKIIKKQKANNQHPLQIAGMQKDKQIELANYILDILGFDKSRGSLFESVHPYSITISPNDFRVSSRYNPNQLEFISSVTHENGHSQYEQGIDIRYKDSLIGEPLSTGFHESQSRIYELFVGHHSGFLNQVLSKAKQLMPEQLGEVDLQEFVDDFTLVNPGPIRVQADEVTYNLHILIRYEIEKALINDNLSVYEIPELWNAKYKEYLGVTIMDDAEGCLQDVHWSDGSFGYFPSYAYGNLLAAQIWKSFVSASPNWNSAFETGNFLEFKKWLDTNIHQYGSLYPEEEFIKKVTGKDLSSDDFKQHIEEKYLS